MYLSDDGDVLGLRYDNWKMVFMELTTRLERAIGGSTVSDQNQRR